MRAVRSCRGSACYQSVMNYIELWRTWMRMMFSLFSFTGLGIGWDELK